MKDIDHIPGVDYQKQQLATDLCKEGLVSYEQHNMMVRQGWPRCWCGQVSVGCVLGEFYCFPHYVDAFERKKARQ